MAAKRIPLTYRPTGERVWWTVERIAPKGQSPWWIFTDDTGYERHGGQNWNELVERVLACAENHDMACSLAMK